jgi:hypothetical protein
MSALVEPSRDAFQSLTPRVVTRHRRVGSFFRRPASASCAALEPTGSVSPSDQNRSTVPSLRGAISSVARRWRNDSRRLPSCPNPLSASADPHGVSAMHTRRLAAPDRVIRHAFPVTFEHDACAPFRSGAGLTQRLCGDYRVHCSTRLHRPSRPIRFGDERLPSVSADRAVCDGLTRPPAPCLATVRGARARCVRPTSASHYFFHYEHSRHIRSQHLFEACASPLLPGLAPWMMEAGGPGGSRRPIRFGGQLRVFARRLLPRAP